MSDRVPMTPAGHQALRAEVKHLKQVERPKVSKEIGEAADHGDLKENAEYHAAREKQGMMEARIAYIEDRLARAEVIDPSKLSGERVIFGAVVTLYDVDQDSEVTYRIVGEDEADLEKGEISVMSPIARGLIGASVDDEVKVKTGAGLKSYEIVSVSFEA